MSLLHPEDVERHRALVGDAVAHGTAWHSEFRIIRPIDGKIAWLEERATAEPELGTGRLRMAGVVWHVTERKEAEERQRLMAREADHRAKNVLAVVQSALWLTQAPDLAAYRQAVEGRVGALARAQTLLADDRGKGAGLRALLEGEVAPFVGDGQQLELEGPDLTVPGSTAQPLAMAVHELATNAVKYGALSEAKGCVAVSWRVDGGSRPVLRLRWTETGGRPLGSPPTRHGFGSRVLDGTVRGQLGGRVSLAWERTGLVCDIEVPLGGSLAVIVPEAAAPG